MNQVEKERFGSYILIEGQLERVFGKCLKFIAKGGMKDEKNNIADCGGFSHWIWFVCGYWLCRGNHGKNGIPGLRGEYDAWGSGQKFGG
jgi:hypothetical protein